MRRHWAQAPRNDRSHALIRWRHRWHARRVPRRSRSWRRRRSFPASANPSGLRPDDVFEIVRWPRGRWQPPQPLSCRVDRPIARPRPPGGGDGRPPKECEWEDDPRSSAASLNYVCNGPRNAQIYLSACSDLAPYIKSRADLLGTLAHAGQTPVTIPSSIQEFRVDTLSVITDTQRKKAFAIRDLRFDSLCLCVVECISQRLARDAINV